MKRSRLRLAVKRDFDIRHSIGMGIDLLDIAFRIEKAFGIRLKVEELFEMPTKEQPEPAYHTTVGEVYALILEKRKALDLPKGKVRPEALAMRDVRLALARILHMSPEEFLPGDRLSRLIPLQDRRKLWRRLRQQLRGLGPLKPRRTRFRYARWVALLVAAAGVACGIHYLKWHIGWAIFYLASLTAGAFVLNTAGDAWSAKLVPKEVGTVELLAKSHLARNRRRYIDECGGAESDDDVWHTLRIIVADALGVDIKEVTKEADLVRDLGAD